ncbi:MAG TPA: hypothetical protein VIW07_13180 [Candidatus Udaeobacter sp.]
MNGTKDALEILGKALLAATGFCYAIGLIVVNVHLSEYRVYSLNLLQLNYVMAGLWALLPIMLSWLIASVVVMAAIQEMERRHQAKWTTWTVLAVVGGTIATCFGALRILYKLCEYLGFKFTWSWVRVVLLGFAVGFMVVGLAWELGTRATFKTLKSFATNLVYIFSALGFFVFYIAVFAHGPYSDIPSGFGGGRPSFVQLVVDPKDKPFLTLAKVNFPQSDRSDPVQLLLATDKELIVLPQINDSAVSVSTDIVKAVILSK